MKLFKKRGKKEEKMVTDFDKYINSEIGTITTDFILPKFNRQVAVNAYEGYWAAAIDYNVNAAASGIIRLFAKVSNNGQKCLFDTTKHKSIYQRDYIEGKTVDKPSQNAQYKIMDSREDFEIVQGHPITDLFTRANPYQSTYQFFYQVYLNLEICGDAFIHVVSYPDGTPARGKYPRPPNLLYRRRAAGQCPTRRHGASYAALSALRRASGRGKALHR